MAALIDCVRAGILTAVILVTVAVGTASVGLWQTDTTRSEASMWIRDGAQSCRRVPVSEATGALPCQS